MPTKRCNERCGAVAVASGVSWCLVAAVADLGSLTLVRRPSEMTSSGIMQSNGSRMVASARTPGPCADFVSGSSTDLRFAVVLGRRGFAVPVLDRSRYPSVIRSVPMPISPQQARRGPSLCSPNHSAPSRTCRTMPSWKNANE